MSEDNFDYLKNEVSSEDTSNELTNNVNQIEDTAIIETETETKETKKTKKSNPEKKEILSEVEKTVFEKDLLKIEKVRNFINTTKNDDKKVYLQLLNDIEKDINNVLNVRLSKREKDLLIKYIG